MENKIPNHTLFQKISLLLKTSLCCLKNGKEVFETSQNKRENPPPRAIISAQKLAYTYNPGISFDFSLDIKKESFNIIIGPSGSGKSTLLMLVSGILVPQAGFTYINGINCTGIPPYQRNLELLFQNYNLFPHLTVLENIFLALRENKASKKNIPDFISNILEQLQVFDLKDRFPEELSGGQLQRASLARCLVRDKRILLLDEPFSHIEPVLRSHLIKYIYSFHKKKGNTVLITTHNPFEFRSYKPNIIFVNSHEVKFSGSFEKFLISPDKAMQNYLQPFYLKFKKSFNAL